MRCDLLDTMTVAHCYLSLPSVCCVALAGVCGSVGDLHSCTCIARTQRQPRDDSRLKIIHSGMNYYDTR